MGAIFFLLLLLLLQFSSSYQSPDLPLFQTFKTSPSSQHQKWVHSIINLQSNDDSRLIYLSSLMGGRPPPPSSSVPLASGRLLLHSPTFVVKATIGTPPEPLLVSVDTANELSILPCNPTISSTSFLNLSCSSPLCSPSLNPACSSSSSNCAFNRTYGSSAISLTLAQDTLSLIQPIPSYSFACLRSSNGSSLPSQGLLGLGRGPLSFPSQTNSLYNSTFSYCLPSSSSQNFTGSLRLGPLHQPRILKTTPLLKSQHRSNFYYVEMVGIVVGGRSVVLPPRALEFDPPTGAGTIFDSGTVFTRFTAPVYAAVRDEFRRRMGGAARPVSSLGGFDTCYEGPVGVMTITLLFRGMNLSLSQENFLIKSSFGGLSCLAMAATPYDVNVALNVVANMQQQNHRVLYDVPNSRLGVVREICT